MAYLNIGGIGVVLETADLLPVSDLPLSGALRLVAPYNGAEVRRVEAPKGGWTAEALMRELNAARYYAESFAPVDAFVGERWLGSTEI